MFECYVPANSRMPAPHSYDGFEQTIYRVEGTTTWTIAATRSISDPVRRCAFGSGRSTGFQNHGDVDATFLAIATLAVFGPAYFREIGEVLANSTGAPRIWPRWAR